MALTDTFTLNIVAVTEAVEAQLSITGGSGQIVKGEDFQINFTYTKGAPAVSGNFSMEWTLPSPSAPTPSGSFEPSAPDFSDDAIVGPGAVKSGSFRGTAPSTVGRYLGKVTVFQPAPE